MDSDFDDVIEVARGGGFSFTDMIYYNSWTLPSYTVNIVPDPPNEDLITFTSPNSGGSSSEVSAASLWLFNDGSTPIPSNEIKYYLTNSAMTKFDYTGSSASLDITITPIIVAFDPALITSLSELLALTTGAPNFTVEFNADVHASPSGANENSLSEFDYFYISDNDLPVFGLIIDLKTGSGSDIDVQVNSKTLKVVTQ